MEHLEEIKTKLFFDLPLILSFFLEENLSIVINNDLIDKLNEYQNEINAKELSSKLFFDIEIYFIKKRISESRQKKIIENLIEYLETFGESEIYKIDSLIDKPNIICKKELNKTINAIVETRNLLINQCNEFLKPENKEENYNKKNMQVTFEKLPEAVTMLFEKLANIEKLLLENSNKNELLNLDEACEFLQLGKSRVYTLVRLKQIKHSKLGNRLWFSKNDLIEMINQKKTD